MGEKQGQPNNARLIAALKFYACSCEPGHCAMSADGDDVPCDDQLCGRTARDALRAIEAAILKAKEPTQ
jgi:hypothetical protein